MSIRAIYGMEDGASPTISDAAEKYKAAVNEYREIKTEHEQSKRNKELAVEFVELFNSYYTEVRHKVERCTQEFEQLYVKLTTAVNQEADIRLIFEIEEQYLLKRTELSTLLEEETYIAASLMALADDEQTIAVVPVQEVLDTYKLVEEVQKDYQIAATYEDIGIVKDVAVPTSNGEYIVNSPFGMRANPFNKSEYQVHRGLDLKAAYGDQNLAAFNGVVVVSTYSSTYGYYVILDHGQGVRTLYAHGVENLVEVGDVVKQYDPIQNTGSTGFSTGPHLHFAVSIDGQFVDPAKLFS